MTELLQSPLLIGGVLLAVLSVIGLLLAFAWREVVGTNVVHIVQTRKLTVSYGSNLDAGNVYYAIPSYIPIFGLTRTILPVNNFALDLNQYKAYDKDRVPFELHVTAFFRVADTNMAAARVQNFEELQKQLEQVVKGAVRKILASHDIHTIMTSRATFGEQFTAEVAGELANWGVVPVKNMELMDIKDLESGESKVIANIMAKKSSHIEMESRIEVAVNKQKAESAEIEAKRAIELSTIEAERTTELSALEAKQAVGERTAEQEKVVGVAREKSAQEIKAAGVLTKQREMEIISVEVQRKAEIQKAAAIVVAEQEKQVTVTVAQGALEQTKLAADGTRATGEAKAAAEKALQLAPVEAQIVLAKEIGSNQSYQTYLVTLRQVEAAQAVGIAQAVALEGADIKVFANTGDAPSGISSIGELLGSKGGQQIGAFVEALKATPTGEKLVSRATGNGARA
jgi:flotillin